MATEPIEINLPVEENKANGNGPIKDDLPAKVDKLWYDAGSILIRYGLIIKKVKGKENKYEINLDELTRIFTAIWHDLRRRGYSEDEIKIVLYSLYTSIRNFCLEKKKENQCDVQLNEFHEVVSTVKMKIENVSSKDNTLRKTLYEIIYELTCFESVPRDYCKNFATVITTLIIDEIQTKIGVRLEPLITARNIEISGKQKFRHIVSDPYIGIYIVEISHNRKTQNIELSRIIKVSDYYIDDIKIYREKKTDMIYRVVKFKPAGRNGNNGKGEFTKVFNEYHGNLKSFIEKHHLYVSENASRAISAIKSLVERYETSYADPENIMEKYIGTGFYSEEINGKKRIIWQGPNELNNIPNLPEKANVKKARIAVEAIRRYAELYGYAPQILRVLYYMVSAPLSYMIRKSFRREFLLLLNFGNPGLGKTRTTILFARIHGLSEDRDGNGDNDRIVSGSDLNIARISRLADRTTYPLIIDEGESTTDIFTRPSNKALIDYIKSSTSTAAKRYISDGYGTRSFAPRSPLIFTLNVLTDSFKKHLGRRFIFNEFTEDLRKDEEAVERIWRKVERYMDDYLPHLGAIIRDWILANNDRVIEWIEKLGTTDFYNGCGEEGLIQNKMTVLELGRLILRCTLKESLGMKEKDMEWLKPVDIPENSNIVMDPYAVFIEFIKGVILEAYQRNVGTPLELRKQAKECVERYGGPEADKIDTEPYNISSATTWCERICVLATEKLLPNYIQVTPKGNVFIDSSSEKLINDIKKKYRNWSFSGSKEQFFKELAKKVAKKDESSNYSPYKLPSGRSVRAWKTDMNYWCQMLEEESKDPEM